MTTEETATDWLITKKNRGGKSLGECRDMINDVFNRGTPEVIDRFCKAINEDGCDILPAYWWAFKQSPGALGTDRSFLEGHQNGGWMSDMTESERRVSLAAAKRAGISVAGKIWKKGLGSADNPLAWISDAADVRRSCEIQGLRCSGSVTVKQDTTPPKPIKLADDIVAETMAERCVADPALAKRVIRNKKARESLRREVIETHGNPDVKA